MGMWIGRNRKARVTYGFDEIALVPGEVTINPLEVDTSFQIPRKDGTSITLKVPIIASAMDGVTDVPFCIDIGRLGGLGVINLEGVQTRYENPAEVLEQVVKAGRDEVTTLIQKIYLEPIKEELISRRVQELKKAGVLAAVSSIPQKAERFAALAQEAGADFSSCNRRSPCGNFHAIQIARPHRVHPRFENPRDRRQQRHLQRDAGIDGLWRGGSVDRSRARRCLHQPGRARIGSPTSDRHGRLRRRAGHAFQKNGKVCSHHHRWRDEQGR